MYTNHLRCKDLKIPDYVEGTKEDLGIAVKLSSLIITDFRFMAAKEEEDHLSERSIQEVYYLWQLAGGDLLGALKKAGLVRTRPPITKINKYLSH